jgi:putative spermidine/putrescine transport system permease protein
MARAGETRLGVGALHTILISVLIFMAAPIVIVVANSFNSSPFNLWPPVGFTVDWYARALNSPAFQRGMVNSVVAGIASTLLVLVLGTPVAYALARFRFNGSAAIRALLLGPLIVPRVAIGFALFVLFIASRSGLYGTMTGVVTGHAVLMLPFVVSVLVANIGEVDPALEEAARDLGAGPVLAFVRVVLPQMQPGLVVAGMFAFITSFDEIETTIFLVKPVVNTLPVEMYLYLDQKQDPTIAALSSLLIGLSLIVVGVGLLVARGNALRYLAGGKAS